VRLPTAIAAAVGLFIGLPGLILLAAAAGPVGWIIAGCVVGYIGSTYGTKLLGNGQLGVLLGAFSLGVLSNLYARMFDRPSQVVSVPAVLLLVPGGMGFRGTVPRLALGRQP